MRVPQIRTVVKETRSVSLDTAIELLDSPLHEVRLLGILMLVDRYQRGDDPTRKRIYDLYLKRPDAVNNWDLVDLSAPNIVGTHLLERSRKPLHHLSKSRNLWSRRVAIVATFTLIRANDFEETLAVSDTLLTDHHDLIHKACGWMLREVGKRDQPLLESFLRPRLERLPRTMLRYAIERFDEPLRQSYLKGTVTR